MNCDFDHDYAYKYSWEKLPLGVLSSQVMSTETPNGMPKWKTFGGESCSQAPCPGTNPLNSDSHSRASGSQLRLGPGWRTAKKGGHETFWLSVKVWSLGWHIPLSGEESALRHLVHCWMDIPEGRGKRGF